MARMLPSRLRATLVWCEWGPVPFPMRKGIPRWAYLRAADQVALVMAISQGTADNLIDVGVSAAKVVTVPNAMRTEEIDFSAEGRARVREQLGIPADAFVVGCISRFHPKKRNDVVVDAVRQLDDERAHLILAGSGETEAALRTRGAPLGDRLHVIPTPRDDVGDVLSAFDVSVFCPSPTEGQPRATILGMLARRPCLSTGAEGVSDMITPEFGAISSPENDPTALARAAARTSMTQSWRGARARRHARTPKRCTPRRSSPRRSRGCSARRARAASDDGLDDRADVRARGRVARHVRIPARRRGRHRDHRRRRRVARRDGGVRRIGRRSSCAAGAPHAAPRRTGRSQHGDRGEHGGLDRVRRGRRSDAARLRHDAARVRRRRGRGHRVGAVAARRRRLARRGAGGGPGVGVGRSSGSTRRRVPTRAAAHAAAAGPRADLPPRARHGPALRRGLRWQRLARGDRLLRPRGARRVRVRQHPTNVQLPGAPVGRRAAARAAGV